MNWIMGRSPIDIPHTQSQATWLTSIIGIPPTNIHGVHPGFYAHKHTHSKVMLPIKLGKDPFNQKHGGRTRCRMNSVHILVFATLVQQCCPQTFAALNMCPDSKPGSRLKTFPGTWIIQVQLQTTKLDRTLDCLINPNTLV